MPQFNNFFVEMSTLKDGEYTGERKVKARYERVPMVEEVDRRDTVAYMKARDQRIREQAVHIERARLIQEKITRCYQMHGVNHKHKCRHLAEIYLAALEPVRNVQADRPSPKREED